MPTYLDPPFCKICNAYISNIEEHNLYCNGIITETEHSFKSVYNAISIQELIEILQKIEDKNLPIFIRPKYSGNINYTDEVPIKKQGISEMENKDGEIDRVVFLI